MTRKTPTQMALDALDAISRHEKECGLRWQQNTEQIIAMREQIRQHAARWEKVAFFVIGTVGLGIFTVFLEALL